MENINTNSKKAKDNLTGTNLEAIKQNNNKAKEEKDGDTQNN